MKILIAGATGAIGKPLIHLLSKDHHEIYGITQSKQRAATLKEKGTKPFILDVLDRTAVFSAMEEIKPDIVVDMLTRLPKEYTPESMRDASVMDTKIRIEGGGNLLAAAEIHGVKRYIAQSTGFWYAPGVGPATENDPLASHASPGIAARVRVYEEIENRLLKSSRMEGVILRFGFFYGPGTWFYPGENMADQVQKQQFFIIGEGNGIWNFIHIEDAAKAVVQAIHSPHGIYNIVNDTPLPLSQWLPAFARFVGAKPPLSITEGEGEAKKGPDFVYYATKLRAASNHKAKGAFDFAPRQLEWLA